MSTVPSTPERCKLVINEWRNHLLLTNREQTQLRGELKILDLQIQRLNKKCFRAAAFGRVGVGKSSLLNALLKQDIFATDVAHGCTRKSKISIWNHSIRNLKRIELIDTPGIDEIASEGRERLAARVALQVDLVIFVLDSDISKIELKALEILLKSGKPVLIALNRCDQWKSNELNDVIKSIQKRLPKQSKNLEIQIVEAAPRKVKLQSNGQVRSELCSPKVKPLLKYLTKLLDEQGELLLALNALREAENFCSSLKLYRLKRNKKKAQGLIGKFATLKASGVAVNPLVMLDLAAGLAFDAALVMELSKLYGLQMQGYTARKLLKHLSINSSLLGGAQLGIQLTLGALRQILILITPFTNGLSLASSAPVAIAQAALAVHTTKITGRLATQMLLQGCYQNGIQAQPAALLKRLLNNEPQVKIWLGGWARATSVQANRLKALLP